MLLLMVKSHFEKLKYRVVPFNSKSYDNKLANECAENWKPEGRRRRKKKGKYEIYLCLILSRKKRVTCFHDGWPFMLGNQKLSLNIVGSCRPPCLTDAEFSSELIIDFHVCPFSSAVASQGCNNTVPTKTTSKWPGHSCQRTSVHHTRKLRCTNTRGKYLIITSSPLTLCSIYRLLHASRTVAKYTRYLLFFVYLF